MLLQLDDLSRVAYKFVGQLADMNQPVLLDAHIDKGTETGEVTGSTALTFANDAVTTAKILNANVTYAKIQAVSTTVEMKKLVPEVISGTEGDLAKGETLGISYANLVPVLTKAIQEQQTIIQNQQVQIDELKIMMQQLLKKKN